MPAAEDRERFGRLGVWGGFLDPLPTAQAISTVQAVESMGVDVIWLQEYSGVDPFVRAALYLSATRRLHVALGVAVIYGRDAEAMVAAASTLEEAFPGRFVLGLGVSHRALVEERGHEFGQPVATMEAYLSAMGDVRGKRRLPMRVLGALGPRMVELAGRAADGAHTYFAPVAHTRWARSVLGPDRWLAPTQMVAVTHGRDAWRDDVRRYLALCLGMPNYVKNLRRFGLTEENISSTSDALVNALVVADEIEALRARLDDQHVAGADHVVLQLVPPPRAEVVTDWIAARLPVAQPPGPSGRR